jgi:predicted kinase
MNRMALAELGALLDEPRPPTLVVLAGLPGLGKTTLARELADGRDVDVVSLDDVRAEVLGTSEYSHAHRDRIYGTAERRVRDSLAGGRHVIIDSTAVTPDHRARWIACASARDRVVCAFFWHFALLSQARRPNIPQRDLARIAQRWVTPMHDEGFAAVFPLSPQPIDLERA